MSTLKYGTQDLNPVVNINPIDDSTASDTSVYSSNKTQGLVDDVEDEVAQNLLRYNLSTIKPINTYGTWTSNVYSYKGITATINSDNSVTFSGTCTGTFGLRFANYKCPIILSKGTYTIKGVGGIYTCTNTDDTWVKDVSNPYTTFDVTETTKYGFRLDFKNGVTYEETTIYPMLELGSVAHAYKPYDESYATHEEVRANRFDTLQNEGIAYPTINGITNYEDASGVYHKNLGCVDLGTLTWVYDATVPRFITDDLKSIVTALDDSTIANIYCPCYTTMSFQNVYSGSFDKAISARAIGTVTIVNKTYTDIDTFKSAMSGVLLFYELATPQTWNSRGIASNLGNFVTRTVGSSAESFTAGTEKAYTISSVPKNGRYLIIGGNEVTESVTIINSSFAVNGTELARNYLGAGTNHTLSICTVCDLKTTDTLKFTVKPQTTTDSAYYTATFNFIQLT